MDQRNESAKEAADMSVSTTPQNISVTLPNPTRLIKRLPRPTRLMIFGVAIPLYLLWLANLMIFSFAPVGTVISRLLELDNDQRVFGWASSLVGRLAFWDGFLYVIFGFIFTVAAVLLARFSFRRWMARSFKVGDMPITSIMYAVFTLVILIGTTKLLLMFADLDLNAISNLLATISSGLLR